MWHLRKPVRSWPFRHDQEGRTSLTEQSVVTEVVVGSVGRPLPPRSPERRNIERVERYAVGM